MFLNPNLVGKEFSNDGVDPNTVWTVQGYSSNTGTIVIIGSTWDQASNRTRLHSFKLNEIKFKGQF